eukprot:103964-Pleurochrysis_carterae.AAC.1
MRVDRDREVLLEPRAHAYGSVARVLWPRWARGVVGVDHVLSWHSLLPKCAVGCLGMPRGTKVVRIA